MNKTKICGIYCIENIDTNKKYIGQSINIKERWNKHKYSLRNNSHDNDFLQKAWNKHGEDKFKFYILEECDKSKLNEKEIYYIDLYKTLDENYGYNLKAGGQNGVVSEYGNLKRINSLKRAYSTTDLRERSRQAALKQWANPEIKAKILGKNNGMYGKTHTLEARKKMSEASMGRPSCRRDPRPVLCIELNKVYSCAAEAQKELRPASSILEVCKGLRKTAGGYHWKFLSENNIS